MLKIYFPKYAKNTKLSSLVSQQILIHKQHPLCYFEKALKVYYNYLQADTQDQHLVLNKFHQRFFLFPLLKQNLFLDFYHKKLSDRINACYFQ